MSDLRPELPPMPDRIARLPLHRGYPVPWFVAWLSRGGEVATRGDGEPDFRVLYPDAIASAHNFGTCWICGDRLGGTVAFVAGPMCAVNRVSAEPPSHVDCADWAARACPFLTRPKMERREAGLPEETETLPGIALKRNPGVAVVWITKRTSYRVRPVENGVLFNIGEPTETRWYAEGREAERAEIEESIVTGLPALEEVAAQQGPRALRELARMLTVTEALLPA